jgi:outer membrane protein insertion porin family
VRFGEPVVEEVGRVDSGIPFVGGKDRGLKVTVPVEEGRVYTVGDVTVQGASVYPADVVERVLGLTRGEVLSLGKVRKAVYEDLEKLYGERGYVNFEATFVPDLRADGVADLHVTLDEGRSFVLDRLEFKGNTFTRDKVLRREVLLNEGEPYNQRLFDLSILRLNQLGYFDTIKETDADIRTDPKTGKVGVDLRVQEKGRQNVQFSGATAGTGGAFFGLQYSTNNLLGYGESLAVDMQTGNRTNRFAFSFTEPYLLDRPVSVGAQVYYQTYQFFGGFRAVDAGAPEPSDVLFTQKTVGGAVSLSTPLSYFFRRSALARFARLGLTYSYSTSSIEDPDRSLAIDPTGTLSLTFQQAGVVTSTVVPSLTFSTLDGGFDPTRGQYLRLGLALSGGPAGGDVNTIQPSLEYQLYTPVSLFRKEGERRDVFAMRLVAGHVRSYGEPFATNSLSFVGGTPYGSRYFLGGEDTIRGFEVRAIAPIARAEQYLTQSGVYATTDAGRAVRVAPGAIRKFTHEDLLVGETLVAVGADTQLLANFEYRIPIAGPVTFTAFADVGSAFNLGRLDDQFTTAAYASSTLSPLVAITPRGRLATAEQIRDATTPETPEGALPAGFRAARFFGDQEVTTAYRFSTGADGFRDGLRYSIGGELRVMIPVVNVPFRIIFAHNPNARLGLGEERNVVKFGIGKTF